MFWLGVLKFKCVYLCSQQEVGRTLGTTAGAIAGVVNGFARLLQCQPVLLSDETQAQTMQSIYAQTGGLVGRGVDESASARALLAL